MKNIVFLIFSIPLLSFGQTNIHKGERSPKQKNEFDFSGRWLNGYTGKKDSAQGETMYYYPSGTIKAKGNRVNGEWKEFFESGHLRIKQTYSDGMQAGETFCYSESGSILLPRFIPQSILKNDTSVNNAGFNAYRLFDSRDSANDILNMGANLTDSIRICDNGQLAIFIGTIRFDFKPAALGIHVVANVACSKNISTHHSSY